MSRVIVWSLTVVLCAPALASAQGKYDYGKVASTPSISIAWDANTDSNLLGYRVYVGTAPSVYSENFDAAMATTFTYNSGVAGRRYYFAVAAYAAGSLESPRSAEVSSVFPVSTTVGGTTTTGRPATSPTTRGPTTTRPGSGTSPIAAAAASGILLEQPVVLGEQVTLNWNRVGDIAVTEFILEAGTTNGASDIYNSSVGTMTSLTTAAPPGTYFVRVRARRSDGSVTPPSNEVSFSTSTQCETAPEPPDGVVGSIVGGTVTMTWLPTFRATSYVVQAGSWPGWSDLFMGDIGANAIVTAAVESGFTGYLRVIAVNACGQSAASNEILVQ